LSATRHLRARGYTKPILALTAASLQGERERCLEAGCNDYLSKPIDAETLLTRIQTLLRREKKASQQIPEKVSTIQTSTISHTATIKRPILLVEDNRDAREATALLLNHLGWEVITAKDGQDALEAIREVRPVAALLDINLPDMNGYELAIRLRKAGLKSARFIALSGQQPDHLKAAESGFDDHLIKPIDLASLHLMLNSIK